jgi:post-segregation antitoxin (ccd killing protein)
MEGKMTREEMMEDNLKLWNSVEKTNPEHTKKVTVSGHTFTAIDAYYQIKNATEQWGAYGDKWGFDESNIEMIHNGENILALFHGVFKYPDGKFPLSSSITVKYQVSNGKYWKIDGDFAKKVETDAITKALSRLGFNADVFLGRFDDNRYVAAMKEEFKDTKKPEEKEHTWEAKGSTTSTNDIGCEAFSIAIQALKTKDEAHKWKKENQSAIDSLGADKGKVMTEYLSKVKELS